MRIAHSRFNKHKPVKKQDRFDRVVTSAWEFEPEKGILTYGATIYNISKENWNKKEHLQTAVKRLVNNPIRVQLESSEQLSEIANIAIDWFIAQKLVFEFGTHNTNKVDVRRIHGTVTICSDFNNRFSPLKPKALSQSSPTLSFPFSDRLNIILKLLFLYLFYRIVFKNVFL